MNAIETHGLGKRYGRAWALRDCTLSIPAGRVVALVGPNGAGKTTLLQLAVGLIGQSAGEIGVLDGPRARLVRGARRHRVRGTGHSALQLPDRR